VPRKFRISWNPRTVERGNLLQRRNLFDDSHAFAAIVRPNGEAGEGMLDDIDRVLLQALQRDGQVSYAELGGHVGLSASAANDRLGIPRTHSLIALSSAEETRKTDTTVPGTGQ
jgi:hypothetical protein